MGSGSGLSVRGIDSWLKRPKPPKLKENEKRAKEDKCWERLSDGDGLYLVRGGTGAAWVYMYMSVVHTKRREMGLGAYPAVGLAVARELANGPRELVARGIDPLDERERERAARVTFGECAKGALQVAKARWRNVEDETVKWDAAIAGCKAIVGVPVKDVGVSDIAKLLGAFDDRPTQKRYVLSVIRRVFDMAVAKELRAGNPATARVIGKITSLDHKTTHNAAMPYADVPAFVKRLRASDTMASRCLELIILTGVRKSEAAQARFTEIDFANAIWNIPAERTKKNRAHDVPLTDRCMALLLEQQLRHPMSAYVFPGGRNQPHLSHGAFQHLVPDDVTVHGFRSALRDYLGNETQVSSVRPN